MNSLWTVAVVAAMTQVGGANCPNCQNGGGGGAHGASGYGAQAYGGVPAYGGAPAYGGGQAYGGGPAGYAGNASGYGEGPVSYSGQWSGVGGPVGPGSGGYDQLYPFDDAQTWVHGYFQEIPAYGGYNKFRPYNYRHVLSQSQVAAGWGMSPTLGYSQEVFRRYPPLNPTTTQNRASPGNAESVYLAEMARLRAQRDFTRSQSESTRRTEAPAQTGAEPVLKAPVTFGHPEDSRSPVVTTAVHSRSRSTKIDDLQAQLRQQQRELQRLQDEIDRAQRN